MTDIDLNDLQRIEKMLDTGVITRKSLEDYLNRTIEEEINQAERPADQALINSCLDLLAKLQGKEESISPSKNALPKIRQKIIRYEWNRRLRSYGLRIAAVFLIICIGGITLEYYRQQPSLQARSTYDEQMLLITGTVQKDSVIAEAEASGEENQIVLEGITLKEAIEQADFDIRIPTWLPEGWNPEQFNLVVSKALSRFSIAYHNEKNDMLIRYISINYKQPDEAMTSIEQDENGEYYHWDGKEVYVTTNVDRTVGIWLLGTQRFRVSGPITNQELKRIIESIK